MRLARALPRPALATLAVALLALVAAGCGGGDGSTTAAVESAAQSGGPGQQSQSPGSQRGSASNGSGGGHEAGSESGPGPHGGEEAPQTSGKGAQAFVQPHGDNSIPGFGEEADRAEVREAERAVNEYLDAREAGDWKTACALLSPEALQKLELVEKATRGKVKGCPKALEALAGGSPRSSRANLLVSGLAAVRVKRGSNTAFALFHGPQGVDYVVPLLREPDSWKIVQLTPIPYPLGTQAPAP
jgi:hypothetical protein